MILGNIIKTYRQRLFDFQISWLNRSFDWRGGAVFQCVRLLPPLYVICTDTPHCILLLKNGAGSLAILNEYFLKYTCPGLDQWRGIQIMTNPVTISTPRTQVCSKYYFALKGTMVLWKNSSDMRKKILKMGQNNCLTKKEEGIKTTGAVSWWPLSQPEDVPRDQRWDK